MELKGGLDMSLKNVGAPRRIHSMELKDSDTMTIGSGGIRVVVSQL
jgi:hypothetical protein